MRGLSDGFDLASILPSSMAFIVPDDVDSRHVVRPHELMIIHCMHRAVVDFDWPNRVNADGVLIDIGMQSAGSCWFNFIVERDGNVNINDMRKVRIRGGAGHDEMGWIR